MIGTRVVTDFPLCDQEILLRHLHKTAWDYVNAYKEEKGLANGHAASTAREGCHQCLSCRRNSPTSSGSPTGACPTEEERYQKRLASTMAEMQDFYDAAFPRLEDVMAYCDARFPLDGMPDDAKALIHMMQSLVMVSFPVEVWKQPRVLDSGATYITSSRSRWSDAC